MKKKKIKMMKEKKNGKLGPWTQDEIQELMKEISNYRQLSAKDGIDWDRVTLALGRSIVACQKKYTEVKIAREAEEKELASSFKGVRSSHSGRKFVAQVSVNGVTKGLGTFDTALEAAQAHDDAAIQAGRPKHLLNFPEDL